jgi:uncharacterized membrane protein
MVYKWHWYTILPFVLIFLNILMTCGDGSTVNKKFKMVSRVINGICLIFAATAQPKMNVYDLVMKLV